MATDKPTAGRNREGGEGVGVDRFGDPVFDPTTNVFSLVEAAALRQDDLRDAHAKFVDAQMAHVKEVGELRACHSKEIRTLETERLNSIRAVDVAGGEREAKRALDAIQALATATQVTAETLRTGQTNMALAIAKETADKFSEVSGRLAALERSSYEGKGKEAVTDPALAQLVLKLDALAAAGQTVSGASSGQDRLLGFLGVAVGLVIAALAIFLK